MKVNGIEVAGAEARTLIAYKSQDMNGAGILVTASATVTEVTIPGWGPLPVEPPIGGFTFSDTLRGDIADEGRWDEIRTEPTGKAAVAVREYGTSFRAPGNTGKALVSKYLPAPLGAGYRHTIAAKVAFPSNIVPRQCFLFDLEASRAAGGGDSEAGIRVKVNDTGLLEIAGDKIGGAMWRSRGGAPKLTLGGAFNDIKVVIDATLDDAYAFSVNAYVNGFLAVQGNGRTLPELGYKGVTASVIDRLQAGLTANGGTATQEVVMSDLTWTVTP